MGGHDSYHKNITEKEAEQRLHLRGGHCYLTRYSSIRGRCVLSVYKHHELPLTPEVGHFDIIEKHGKYRIEGKKAVFDNVGSLLEYYQKYSISPAFKSIGQVYTEDAYKVDVSCNIL